MRKNETELAKAEAAIQIGLELSRSRVPSNRMAAYQTQLTSWSMPTGYRYTNLLNTTSERASSTTGTQNWRRDPRAPKNSRQAATGVKCHGCACVYGMINRAATANNTNR